MKKFCFPLVLFLLALSLPLRAQFFYNETCRDASGVFQYYGQAPGYTAAGATPIDPVGDGWLRLTDNTGTQLGYVLLDKPFPSTMGVTMEFDFKVWEGSPTPADGLSVFLYDGNKMKPFVIGSSGGGLGYYGLSPAYLGVGIDEYGNFSAVNAGGPGLTRHSIAISNASFNYVAGTTANLGMATDISYGVNTGLRPSDAVYYRRARIEMEPIPGGMSATVYLKTTTSGSFTKIIGPVNVI